MSDQANEQRSKRQTAAAPAATAATTTTKKPRPLAGFIIAGASLALLFGIAALKGRVKDDISE